MTDLDAYILFDMYAEYNISIKCVKRDGRMIVYPGIENINYNQ